VNESDQTGIFEVECPAHRCKMSAASCRKRYEKAVEMVYDLKRIVETSGFIGLDKCLECDIGKGYNIIQCRAAEKPSTAGAGANKTGKRQCIRRMQAY